MKSFTSRLAIFAATAVVFGTMAYGQTTLNADIPFTFQTSNATLPAGHYTISRVAGASVTSILRLYNKDSHRSVLAASLPIDMFHKADEKPVMVFACAEQICTLRTIKTSNGTYAYPEAHNKTARDHEVVSMVEIPLTPRNGD
jgi:hypothetical protein